MCVRSAQVHRTSPGNSVEVNIKLQSASSPNRWLRINGTDKLEALGSGGELTEFIVSLHEEDGSISLRSLKYRSLVGIRADGSGAKPSQTTLDQPGARFKLLFVDAGRVA